MAEFNYKDFFYTFKFGQFKYRYTCALYVMREKIILYIVRIAHTHHGLFNISHSFAYFEKVYEE